MKKVIMFPGQGSQYRGMGKNVFDQYSREVSRASEILGYDLEELCLKDPEKKLGKTEFTQPALYVVNALSYFGREEGDLPDYLIGHSLGEYNALLAAGAFDFETGLRLVQERGALMAKASGGGMAAVLGIEIDRLQDYLLKGSYKEIDIANFNTPTQTVISGPQASINKVIKDFDGKGIKIVPLFVTAPFHSRYMNASADEFGTFLKDFRFSKLKIPVISNVTGLPYEEGQVASLLREQIKSPVKWTTMIRRSIGYGASDYEEINGMILTKMVEEIRRDCSPIVEERQVQHSDNTKKGATIIDSNEQEKRRQEQESLELSRQLGNKEFREDYGVQYAYVAGSMYRGIASKELVVLMAKAKMLSFLGAGGMPLKEIESNIDYIQRALNHGEAYGVNLLHNLEDPTLEMETAELYLRYGVRIIEASAFMSITPALVYYRLQGLRKDTNGSITCDHKILAKISRPEVAEAFMKPAPERIVEKLLDQGKISAEQASLSKEVPMSYDICVEADSGGHTDGGVALALFPAIKSLRDEVQKGGDYQKSIRIGLAGGIGSPLSVACAFMMGADFVLTGSINQCTVESGVSTHVKDLLQDINVQDTDYAPAGDMFEIGAKVQVLKKGVLFPTRANKLYKLYQQYNSLEDIPETTIAQLEKSYFKKKIDQVWSETKAYHIRKREESKITEAEENPKKKMALVFKWYFGYSSRLSFEGNMQERVNFQVHTGPALGVFNQWVKGTELENWGNRHADGIGIKMMEEAAQILSVNYYDRT